MTSHKASKSRKRPGASSDSAARAIAAAEPAWLPTAAPFILLAAILAATALYLQREWSIAGLWGFSLDDSWIHAVFARNIATGQGYAFNAGHPVSGSTGPLYSVILAGLYAVTGEMVWSAKLFGILCQCVSAFLVWRAARRMNPDSDVAALAAAILVGISPSLLWASVSGMEISLYLVFVCAGFERYVAGRDVAATLLWALGVWVRPDGIFLVALSMLGPLGSLWKRAAVAAVAIAPFFLFNYVLGGSFFPQTVGAKTHLGFDFLGRTWKLLREWGALWGVPYGKHDELDHPALLLPLILVGGAVLLRRKPVLALYVLGLPLALSLFRDNSASHKRYILYVIPPAMLAAVAGARWLAQRFGSGVPRWQVTRALLTVAAAALVWQGAYVARKAETHGWNVENINMMQRLLGLTAAQMTQPGAVVAASDIGAIGYFSHREVVDLMGLVSKQRSLGENLRVYQPAVMIILVDWFRTAARPDSASGFFAFYDTDSTAKYTAAVAVELKKNTICSGDQMVAFVRQKPGDPPPPLSFHRF